MLRRDPARFLALLLLAVGLAATLHLRGLAGSLRERGPLLAQARLDDAARRLESLVRAARSAATRTSEWPEVRRALAGDAASVRRLFTRLDLERTLSPAQPALAIHDARLATIAWAGPAAPRVARLEPSPTSDDVFVVSGNVSTTLVATIPIREGSALRGVVSAEVPLAVRRSISNALLSDFDRIAGADEGLEVDYLDVFEAAGAAPAERGARVLRSPAGRPLAVVRATDDGAQAAFRRVALLWRRILSGIAVLTLGAWIWRRPTSRRVVAGATLLRLGLLVLGVPFPSPDSAIASPDLFSSTALGPLGRSPLDLLLTAGWLATIAGVGLKRSLAQRRPSAPLPALVADLLAVPITAAVFAGIAEVSRRAAVDLEGLAPAPRELLPLLLQVALLAWMAAGAIALVALFNWAGPLPSSRGGRLARCVGWLVILAVGFRYGPWTAGALPVLPAVLFLVPAAGLGLVLASGIRPPGRRPDVRVLAYMGAGAALGALLAPTLTHLGERAQRADIQFERAPRVLTHPAWRHSVLAEAQRRADALDILEETLPGRQPPLLEELAFAVWSGTELAAAGLPSAVEIQDARGASISRFALSLPLESADLRLPESDEWIVTRDRLALASAERYALHARRRLVYHGELHGAVHVYVGDDLLALPAAGGEDPYSVLFRSTPEAPRSGPLVLVAWDFSRALLLSTADRPPPLEAGVLEQLSRAPGGFWATLPIDGAPHEAFLFSDGRILFGLAYRSRSSARDVAGFLEASSAGALLVLAGAVATLLVRSLLGRETFSFRALLRAIGRRFLLRLFVALVVVAILPVVVLQTLVRGFVADRLGREAEANALALARVAKKAVEDFAYFQADERPGGQRVTDGALAWVATLIRNDLDVFEGPRLLASSKRELYASGLLSARLSGVVYRDLVLEGRPSTLQTARIGALAYRVVSLPLALRSRAPTILSIPLALPERENQAVLADLDRSIRVASILFLVAAAIVARAMAERISGPVRDLTAATRRIAHGDLSARVEPRSRDELAALVTAFNQMASDLERQRRDLERSNRRAAWTDMARQVAHEVKNPLTPIQLAAEHLRRVWEDSRAGFGPILDSCTRTILDQVRVLRSIVTEFSAFARPPVMTHESTDLAAAAEAAARPYNAILPPGVSLHVSTRPVPAVRGDRRLLERAIVNLIENALQAVGEKGTVRLEVAAVDAHVEVSVEDDGPGMPKDVSSRAFEPFFSTKTGGSGLGLPLVRKIAEDHGGSVRLESEAGRTRAVVRLPLSTPDA
jgi:signal transduction histidine kinase